MIGRLLVNPRSLSIALIVVMLLLWFLGYVLRATARTRHLPRCWNCGASKVRRSLPQHFLDTVAVVLFLNPYRCKGCRVRFYGLRSRRQYAEPATNGSVWWGT
jgi:hypothetical protein